MAKPKKLPSGAGSESRLPKAFYVALYAIPVATFWVRISSVLSYVQAWTD